MDMKDRLGKAYGTQGKSGKKDRAPEKAVRESPLIPEKLIKSGKPGIEKAAKFLLLLGQEEAAAVIRHLKGKEVEAVSKAIAGIERIDTTEANEILTEFGWMAKTQAASLEGGPDIAESMLKAAFGDEKAGELIRRAGLPRAKPFQFLNELSGRQIVLLLKDDSPQLVSIILPHLEPKRASEVIEHLNPQARTEVVKRIASLGRLSPEVLEQVETVLRERIARIGTSDEGDHIDGASVLAGILRHVDSSLEENILQSLADENPDLTEVIKEQLFTIEDIYRVSDRDVQKSLKNMTEKDIALILKGKSQDWKDKLLSNVSQSKRIMVLEEYDYMGTVRRDEVNKATQGYLEWFKKRYEDGELILEGDEDLVD